MPDPTAARTPSAVEAKAALRVVSQARRDAMPADERKAAAEAVAARPFPVPITAGLVVSGFMPLRSEINPLPLMRRLTDQGARLALPVIAGRGKPLVLREWQWGAPLAAGVWGIREPTPEAAEIAPDIVLTPLLAFDRAGYRVGYGGGFYDLTLARLRARKPVIAVGLAFASQEVDAVPVTASDARLDLVLTERQVIDFRRE